MLIVVGSVVLVLCVSLLVGLSLGLRYYVLILRNYTKFWQFLVSVLFSCTCLDKSVFNT